MDKVFWYLNGEEVNSPVLVKFEFGGHEYVVVESEQRPVLLVILDSIQSGKYRVMSGEPV